MTKDEALKLALEALQFSLHVGFDESSESQIKKGAKAGQKHRQAITAIKEALAQPAPSQYGSPELQAMIVARAIEKDRAAQPAREPVIGTKTWFEDGKIVTQNLYHSDIYTTRNTQEEHMTHTINSTHTAAVATDYYWIPIDANTPRGVKLQLLGNGGVAAYGNYQGAPFWSHWAPLPKRTD